VLRQKGYIIQLFEDFYTVHFLIPFVIAAVVFITYYFYTKQDQIIHQD